MLWVTTEFKSTSICTLWRLLNIRKTYNAQTRVTTLESSLIYKYSLLPIHAIKGTENNFVKKKILSDKPHHSLLTSAQEEGLCARFAPTPAAQNQQNHCSTPTFRANRLWHLWNKPETALSRLAIYLTFCKKFASRSKPVFCLVWFPAVS